MQFITSDVHLEYLVMVVSARFLHCKATGLPFADSTLWGESLSPADTSLRGGNICLYYSRFFYNKGLFVLPHFRIYISRHSGTCIILWIIIRSCHYDFSSSRSGWAPGILSGWVLDSLARSPHLFFFYFPQHSLTFVTTLQSYKMLSRAFMYCFGSCLQSATSPRIPGS